MNDALRAASEAAFRALRARGAHVSFAESLTGGLICATLVENAGASAVLNESYVTYAAESKVRILGVRRETVARDGVVSESCAREMAEGARRVSGAEWGVSATGLAGPEGEEEKPVGTVYVGVAGPKGARARRHLFSGDRAQVRAQAAQAALELLVEAMAD